MSSSHKTECKSKSNFQNINQLMDKAAARIKKQLNEPMPVVPPASSKNFLQMVLVAYVEDVNWQRLERALTMPMFIEAARSIHENPALLGASILHMALRNKPSVNIINCLLHTFPEALFLQDKNGRYPLHIASSAGISSAIVEIVAMAYPQACMKQDFDGRVPLHYACDSTLYEENHVDISTIRRLLSISPSSVHMEDKSEMNVLELAILSNAKMEVISFLQKSSVSEHRQKKNYKAACTRCMDDDAQKQGSIFPMMDHICGCRSTKIDDIRATKAEMASSSKIGYHDCHSSEGRFKKTSLMRSLKGLAASLLNV